MSVLRAAIINAIIFLEFTVARKPLGFFDGINCSDFDTKYIEKLDCWVMPNRFGYLTMNAALVLKRDLWQVSSKYKFIIEHNNCNMTFLSLEVDICQALGDAFTNPVLNLVASEIRQTSNFPLKCPIKKGVLYIVNNFTINSKYLPPFTPDIKWMSYCTMFTNTSEKRIFQFDTFGRVIRTYKRNKYTH